MIHWQIRLAAGFVLMRDTTDDVVLPCGDLNGLLPVQKGTRVAIDVVGLREFDFVLLYRLNVPHRSQCQVLS